MKMCGKRLVVSLMSSMLLASAVTVGPVTPFAIEAEAHSGRTDANGGHHDNKNKSGLGSYHYHCGGYPAHLHTNGVCPYAAGNSVKETEQKQTQETKAAVKETTAAVKETTAAVAEAGWKEDANGWWYCTSDGQYYKDCWQAIGDQWYYFNADGYMQTGWHCQEDHCYYLDSDGHMVTGERTIGEEHCYFNEDGSLDETHYHHSSGHHQGHHS